MTRQRGQAMVEFALVAPLFFVLFIGLADIGRGLLAYTELAMGSRAAARQAVLQYNASSNTTAGCSSPCVVPGVVPIIQKQAGFGFPISYSTSTSTTQPPTYGTFVVDSGYAANGSTPPIDLSLVSSAATNTVYVFVYEYDPTATSASTRWETSTPPARLPGHEFAVVDLKLKWTSVTLSLLGLTPTLTLDSQTIQRLEY